MKIVPAEVPAEGRRYSGEEPGDLLALDGDIQARPDGSIRYVLDASTVPGELLVRGTLECRIQVRCSRCADSVPWDVTEQEFTRTWPVENDAESVDLTDEIREAIILRFPGYPVCDDACKGLCSQCGINLNTGSCDCKPPPDDRWHGLDGLDVPGG